MIEMFLLLLIILSINAWIDDRKVAAAQLRKEKQLQHEKQEIEARRRRMEEAARQADAMPVSQPKNVVKPTAAAANQPKSTSLSDQQFYDKFGIWPDEMGEHPYNPPTR